VLERPVDSYERGPGIVRVLLKRFISDYNVYNKHYYMMRQTPIAQKRNDNKDKGKTRKFNV